jgi:GR25 family glycosyltransferase involved in LPS biosynthesis
MKGGEKTTTYVINLDKRTDRWNRIQDTFKNLPFNLERISAIENSDDGLLGCTQSFVKAVEQAKQNNLPYILIMEDDCKPTDKLENLWPIIKEWLEKNMDKWEIFLGGNSLYGFNNDISTVKALCKINENLKLYYTSISTAHFICINSSVYDKYIEVKDFLTKEKFNKEEHGSDRWAKTKEMKIVTPIPFIAIQEQSYSNIIKGDVNYNTLFIESEKNINSLENNIDCNISGGKKRIKHKVNRKKIIGGQQKNKIILTLMGGLANRIIQILAGIGFSEKWNMDLFINSEIMYDNNHIKKDKSIEEIKELFPQIPWIESFNKNIETIYDPEEFIYHNIKNPNKDVILHGIFQSEKYFPQNKYNINLKEPNNNIIKNIDKTNLYFIHFRFGDYNNSPRHKLNLIKYYQYCIKEILKNNKNITFIILSDNISDAKNYISTNLNNVLTNVNLIYDENNSRLDTLYFMSKCYGAICPNSTFSWIGAYLIENKGPIYFPKPWLSDHDINKDYDIYSPWMIQININNI